MIPELHFFTFTTIDFGSTKQYSQDLVPKYSCAKAHFRGTSSKTRERTRPASFPVTKWWGMPWQQDAVWWDVSSTAQRRWSSSCSSRPYTELQLRSVIFRRGSLLLKMEGEALIFAELHLLLQKGDGNWGKVRKQERRRLSYKVL